MNINRLYAVYFSATGNTRRVCLALGRTLARRTGLVPEALDFTVPDGRRAVHTFSEGDLVLFGTPVYAGRVPNLIAPRIRSGFAGNGALAIPVVTFGGRGYDDALGELTGILSDLGFRPVAAAAVAARHAFSDRLEANRPDETDLARLAAFGERVYEKITASDGPPPAVSVPCPGNLERYYTPLGTDGKPAVFLKAKPKTDMNRCEGCCFCAGICPMGAIPREAPNETRGTCIKCMACVRRCPARARYFDDPAFLSHVAMLEASCTRPAGTMFFE